MFFYVIKILICLNVKYLYFSNLNFVCYEYFYSMVFTRNSAGKTRSSICVEDHVNRRCIIILI